MKGYIKGKITGLEFKNYKKIEQMCVLCNRTSWDKYMLNGTPQHKF